MRFLIDEMFPPRTCARLVERGHDAAHVRDLGIDARPDREVAAAAARDSRALVTENVKDFAADGIVVVCILKAHLPQHGMDEHLAAVLDQWAAVNPEPYLGLHRPKTER
ncbi:MAG: DUF5615 family PIN-like protein [Pseudonocardiaceae bacterium]